MARFVDGVAIPDSAFGGYGISSVCAGYDGVWGNGEFTCCPCIMRAADVPAEWCDCIASPRVGGVAAIISGSLSCNA
jgi:hypothetical protein